MTDCFKDFVISINNKVVTLYCTTYKKVVNYFQENLIYENVFAAVNVICTVCLRTVVCKQYLNVLGYLVNLQFYDGREEINNVLEVFVLKHITQNLYTLLLII